MKKHEKTYSFQSNNRESDLTLLKIAYASQTFLQNDFIGPIGSYDFQFITGAPRERNEYFTIFIPFDLYTWALIITSLVLVSISLIAIDKLQASWTRQPSNDAVFQSKSEFGILIMVPSIILFL